jgi:hypothetical protein
MPLTKWYAFSNKTFYYLYVKYITFVIPTKIVQARLCEVINISKFESLIQIKSFFWNRMIYYRKKMFFIWNIHFLFEQTVWIFLLDSSNLKDSFVIWSV